MIRRFLPALLALTLVLGLVPSGPTVAQTDSRFFPETGHTVRGLFLAYWNEHGGLAQQGYPLTDEFAEASPLDGQTYTVQYFERAVFEHHPEHASTPYEVLLAQLGTYELQARYPGGPPASTANPTNTRAFAETGHSLGGVFRAYWEAHGGLEQQGYPLTDELTEVSALNGKTYTVQYFERAVFELHPENAGTPYEVLLSQLGTYQRDRRYPSNSPPPALPTVVPSPAPPGGRTLAPVLRVIDGDTIEVQLGGQPVTVRYIGMDTPETVAPGQPVGCYGPEASAANKALVGGQTVALEKDVSETDRYGRLLRYVYVGATFVNAELVRQGYAQVSTFPPDVKYQAEFVRLEQEARSAGRGLWGPTCQGTPVPATATRPAVPPSPVPPPTVPTSGGGVCGTPYSPTGPDRDCGDFSTQAQAQCFFEAAGGPARDPHRLDSDHDGVACESLP